MADSIKVAWSAAQNKINILLPALWAAIRCGYNNPGLILDEMIAGWATLPDAEKEGESCERDEIAQELQFAVKQHGLSESVLKYLIAQAKNVESLRWPITFMLQESNNPIAIRFLLEEFSIIEKQTEGGNRFSPWMTIVREKWDPTKEGRGRRLPPDAIKVLKDCWESETKDETLRKTAFNCWVLAIDDIKELQSIPPGHPQFQTALRRRAFLGDLSSVSQIIPLLASSDRWFYVLSKVWTEECKISMDMALDGLRDKTPTDCSGGRSNEHYMLAHLLRDIPVCHAQQLIKKHWSHLKYSPLFIQAALYIGTEECIKIAGDAIRYYPKQSNPFQYIGSFFGFITIGLSQRLELRHIQALLPFLVQLDEMALFNIVEFCNRHKYNEWKVTHLKPVVEMRKNESDHMKRLALHHFPSDSDLIAELDNIEREYRPGLMYFWCDDFMRRDIPHSRWRSVLDMWFSQKPSIERLGILAYAVQVYGTRKDLDLLDKQAVFGSPELIKQLKDSARFEVMQRSLC